MKTTCKRCGLEYDRESKKQLKLCAECTKAYWREDKTEAGVISVPRDVPKTLAEIGRVTCSRCHEVKDASEFLADKSQARLCKPCRSEYAHENYRKKHPEPEAKVNKTRDEINHKSRMKKYGVTPEWYQEQFIKQEGKCAICGKHQSELDKALCVDHNHETGEVRGLLCSKCNAAIGSLGDSVNLLRAAITYLEDHAASRTVGAPSTLPTPEPT